MPEHRREQGEVPIPDSRVIQQIIVEGDPQVLVEWADRIGEAIARQVTSSQIRNIFGAGRQIQWRWPKDSEGAFRDAVLLKPKIGYFAKREHGRGMEALERILVPALDLVAKGPEEKRQERYDRFMDFFEAILAYHKKYGGN